jgi:sporulation protein YlmC with PRC-barrel domain
VHADRGRRIAYLALKPGTPVYDNEGTRVGTVERVLAAPEEDIFEGILVGIGMTDRRFVEADLVGDLYEHRVELKLSSQQLERQPRDVTGTG